MPAGAVVCSQQRMWFAATVAWGGMAAVSPGDNSGRVRVRHTVDGAMMRAIHCPGMAAVSPGVGSRSSFWAVLHHSGMWRPSRSSTAVLLGPGLLVYHWAMAAASPSDMVMMDKHDSEDDRNWEKMPAGCTSGL
jgi:hypothetical protein